MANVLNIEMRVANNDGMFLFRGLSLDVQNCQLNFSYSSRKEVFFIIKNKTRGALKQANLTEMLQACDT